MASTDAKPVPQKNVAMRITFPILDADGDLVTGATGLDSEVSKDGGTFADCTNEATEIATSSGIYYLDLTNTEMNADTVAVIVKTSSSGAKTTTIVMYPEEAGDIRVNVTAYGGTAGTFSGGRPEVNTTHIAGSSVSTSSAQIGVNVVNAAGTAWGSGAITAASIASDAITAAKIADGAIDAATFAADVDAEILSYIVDDATRIDASALNTASTAVGSNGSGLTEAGGTGDQFTAIPWNAAWDAEVQSEVDDGLVARGLDHLVAAAVTGTDITDDSIIAKLVSKSATADWDSYNNTTDSHEALRDRGDAAWTTATGFSTHSASDVWAAGTRSLTVLDEDSTTLDLDATIRAAVGLASADLDTQLAALPTAAENADAVWDEDATGHQTGGTFGQAIGDPGANTETIYDAVVTDAAGTNVAADIIAIKADTAEIGAAGAGLTEAGGDGDHLTAINLPDQTMNITGNITGNLSGSVGSVTGAVGSVTGNVGGNVTGNVTGTIGGLTAAALKDFFDTDSTTTYASAVAGSVVKEIADNAGGSSLTVADIADAVWEEAIADHSGTAGSTAEALAGASAPTAAEVADAVWDEATAGHTTSGTFGEQLKTDVDAILADTNELQSDDYPTTLATLATSAALATVDSNVDAILADTGTDGVVVASGSKTGYALTSVYDFAKGTTAMTEAYASNGAAPTPVEALMGIHQMLMSFAIAGTSYTVKKLDGSTTAFVVTLDDDTSPTSAVRS